MQEPTLIIFYDGLCNLCNGFIDFVIQNETKNKTKNEAKERIIFAPLQGSTAAQYLSPEQRSSLDSVLVLELKSQKILRESQAILKVLSQMNFPWKGLGFLGFLFPLKIRDGLYRWIARHRIAWFGSRSTCRIPSPEERSRFLD